MTEPATRFDLLDEPWIPCLSRTLDGPPARRELGIRGVLEQAPDLVDITGDTPLQTVALHRLLLAVLHRVFGPEDAQAWARLWERKRFEHAALTDYLERWRDRFDLFHVERPFYQVGDLSPAKARTVANLMLQADNNATLFDHSVVSRPPALAPARAARVLVAAQAFDPAGMKTGERGPASAQAGLLVQSAVLVAKGESLFCTLLLNLHHYSPERDGQPWTFEAARDRPAWERDEPVTADARAPDGYCDWLTWQSRRIRLLPDSTSGAVTHAVLMPGYQLPPSFDRFGRETMVPFRRRPNAKPTESPWWPLGFEVERALWRDTVALCTTVAADYARPRSAQWLADLVGAGILSESHPLPFDAGGLAVDRAKCLFWRHERVPLHASFLVDPDLVDAIRQALQLAETAADLVSSAWVHLPGDERAQPSPLAVLVEHLCPSRDQRKGVQEKLGAAAAIWARLEGPFVELIHQLPDDIAMDPHGNRVVGRVALGRWRVRVLEALRHAFDGLVEAAGTTGRALEATARAEVQFRRHTARLIPRLTDTTE